MKESIKRGWPMLLEFIELDNKGVSVPEDYRMHDIYLAQELAQIADFIIKNKKDVFKMYFAINALSQKKDNQLEFKGYEEALTKEKEKGYTNLMYVLKKRREFHKL